MPKSKYSLGKIPLNKIVILLTLSDIFTWGIYLVLNAIIGIYLAAKLGQDAVWIVGIGTSIFFLTRGLLEIVCGTIVDRLKRDYDEILFLAIGNILMGTSYLFYPKITTPMHYFLLQFVFGVGAILNLVSWRKLFAQNLDKHHEGLDYGIYGAIFSLASALFATLTGIIANINQFYFDLLIITIGTTMIVAALFPLLILTVKPRPSTT